MVGRSQETGTLPTVDSIVCRIHGVLDTPTANAIEKGIRYACSARLSFVPLSPNAFPRSLFCYILLFFSDKSAGV